MIGKLFNNIKQFVFLCWKTLKMYLKNFPHAIIVIIIRYKSTKYNKLYFFIRNKNVKYFSAHFDKKKTKTLYTLYTYRLMNTEFIKNM